jgi:hypothetical protein
MLSLCTELAASGERKHGILSGQFDGGEMSISSFKVYRPIAFDPEGSSLDYCLPVNSPG